uniref:Endo/exonuclease/phosphatase domain-containing protein n=1 Tax=Rodentolepis nana TaxID=102285 RepID=A0A0R3T7K8_RODNA
LHYNGSRTTPDLLLASSDISEHTHRKIIDDPGSGHKPVIASVNIGSKSMTTKVPTKLSWNFKKADWPRFTNLLENELHTGSLNFNQHPDKLCDDIKNIMIRCAKKTIPHGKTKHYRVFWSKHLEELKRKRDTLCNTADQTGRTEDVQAWRRQSAVLRQAILQAKRTSFDKFISNINYQSDSRCTFKFLGNLENNRDRPKKEPIRLKN